MYTINKLKRDKTIIIVSHRLSTVSHYDKIFKIDNGKITSEGIPGEILNNFN
jgi:ATP-binding cassette subfamily B protein